MNHIRLFSIRVGAALVLALCLSATTPADDQLIMMVSVLTTGALVCVLFALLLEERMNDIRLNFWDVALTTFVLALLFNLMIEVAPPPLPVD